MPGTLYGTGTNLDPDVRGFIHHSVDKFIEDRIELPLDKFRVTQCAAVRMYGNALGPFNHLHAPSFDTM